MPFPIVTVRSVRDEPDELFPIIAAPSADLPVLMHADDGETLGVRAREITVRTQNDGHVRWFASTARPAPPDLRHPSRGTDLRHPSRGTDLRHPSRGD